METQTQGWFIFRGHIPAFIAFIIYLIAGNAETNRAPFDLPEAESELTAGFHTEYSGMGFGFFYVAEFIFGSRIVEVSCCYLPKTMGIVAEDGAYIKFGMSNGIVASAKVAFSEMRGGLAGTLTNLGYEIYGDKAAMRGYGTMFQLSGYEDEPIRIRISTAPGYSWKINGILLNLVKGY